MQSRGLCAAIFFAALTASANNMALRGKVVMEDGSVPPRAIAIERDCGNTPQHVASTNTRGEYLWHADVDTASSGLLASTNLMGAAGGLMANLSNNGSCVLRASLRGYESNAVQLDDLNSFSDPVLPTFTLTRRGTQANFDMLTASNVPRAASRAWNRAIQDVRAKKFPEGERQLRFAVRAAPRFAQGWNALATVLVFEENFDGAREAYRRVIVSNPKLIQPHLLLARLDISAKDWPAAANTAAALIKADTRHEYPEAYLYRAIAQYQLNDLANAEASAAEAIRLDQRHEVPSAEYVFGLILESRREYSTAGEHMSKYLELKPNAPDAEAVRSRLEGLGTSDAPPVAAELQSIAANLQLARGGDAWVPGGMKALAMAAHMNRVPAAQDFFAEYCRTIVREISIGTAQGVPQYLETLRVYISTVSALSLLGQREKDSTVIAFSLAGGTARASRILQLLGWKIAPGGRTIEPGDQPADGMSQKMPALFGIDESTMRQTLGAGREFRFEIASENALLRGGGAWTDLLRDKTIGIAAAFAADPHLARAYAGLGSMPLDAASALTSAVGLRRLVTQYSDVLSRDGDAFVVSNREVVTPGDSIAWRKITGVDPANPPAFFRTLLEHDDGSLVEFYGALSRADAAHRRYFLEHADRAYAWDRSAARSWRAAFFEKLPLDENKVRFPGGPGAWNLSSESDLWKLDSLEALVPLAQIEEKRNARLDEESAKLLVKHFNEWRNLFPYFERLPALGRTEFEALEKFAAAVAKLPPVQQNIALGEWDSLLELIARGAAAGSLDGPHSARAFRDACLTDPRTALRTIAGTGDVDDAIPDRLLRLTGARRAAYDRVLRLQSVPRIAAAKTPVEILNSLAGVVYAASLDPDGLLINEDRALLGRHRFSIGGAGLFPAAALNRASAGQGSYMSGSFANFDHIASNLASGGGLAATIPSRPSAVGAPLGGTGVSLSEVTFRASGRLVEVYTMVTDSSGHYIDDLTRDQFTITDNGSAPKIVAFEPRSSQVSVALLLDTTGSMHSTLPALKNAALKLIDELRPKDSVAVYSFNSSVAELQPFTTNKDAAMRAVLSTQAFGETALNDALTRVGRELSTRGGKKVIVVFTDGDDNASTLRADTAIDRAKAAGIPIYTIAQGEALSHPEFLKQLTSISKATGGVSFAIHEPKEIGAVFAKVSADLTHGYLLVFQPEPAADEAWHTIEVGLKRAKSYRLRARDGYYPE